MCVWGGGYAKGCQVTSLQQWGVEGSFPGVGDRVTSPCMKSQHDDVIKWYHTRNLMQQHSGFGPNSMVRLGSNHRVCTKPIVLPHNLPGMIISLPYYVITFVNHTATSLLGVGLLPTSQLSVNRSLLLLAGDFADVLYPTICHSFCHFLAPGSEFVGAQCAGCIRKKTQYCVCATAYHSLDASHHINLGANVNSCFAI